MLLGGKEPVLLLKKALSSENAVLPRFQLLNPLEYPKPALSCRAKQHKGSNPFLVNVGLNKGIFQQRLNLGSKHKPAVVKVVEKGLDANPVTGDKKGTGGAVPDREGIDTVKPFKTFPAPLHECP